MRPYSRTTRRGVLPVVTAALLIMVGVTAADGASKKAAPRPVTHLSVFNLVPDAAGRGLVFYLDGGVFSGPIGYGGSTAFGNLPAGVHRVQVGRTHGPMLRTMMVPLHTNQSYTFVALGSRSDLATGLLLPSMVRPTANTQAAVRFVNAIPTATTVTASLERRGARFGTMPFGSVSSYQTVPAGIYNLQVRTSAGKLLPTGSTIKLDAGKTYTIYALPTLRSRPAPATTALVFTP